MAEKYFNNYCQVLRVYDDDLPDRYQSLKINEKRSEISLGSPPNHTLPDARKKSLRTIASFAKTEIHYATRKQMKLY